MNVFVAEDEPPALERLLETLARVEPDARVVGTAASVREARLWLAEHPAPDLLLLDIQLADGLSLELFASATPTSPVVFATAYDEFVLRAFQANAIDYVLKPVSDAALAHAFAAYRRLKQHFGGDLASLLATLRPAPSGRERLLARTGNAYRTLLVDDIGYFVSVDKLTFAIDRSGERHRVEATLAELEAELDPARFFRVNRQCLVGARAVAGFRPSGKGRLALKLAPPAGDSVIVAQERAAAFRAWLAR